MVNTNIVKRNITNRLNNDFFDSNPYNCLFLESKN